MLKLSRDSFVNVFMYAVRAPSRPPRLWVKSSLFVAFRLRRLSVYIDDVHKAAANCTIMWSVDLQSYDSNAYAMSYLLLNRTRCEIRPASVPRNILLVYHIFLIHFRFEKTARKKTIFADADNYYAALPMGAALSVALRPSVRPSVCLSFRSVPPIFSKHGSRRNI